MTAFTPQLLRPSAKTPAAAMQDAFQQVTATIAVARGLMTSGRAVDLVGLDATAGRLCAQVLDLPPLVGATFRPALIELHSSLGELSALLNGSAR